MKLELTAIGSGYFRVYVNGTEVSKHNAEREANQSAINQLFADPTAKVTIDHDYDVTVELFGVESQCPLATLTDKEAIMAIAKRHCYAGNPINPDPVDPVDPVDPPPVDPVDPPQADRQLLGGWRVKNDFGRNAIAIDFDTRTLYMVGHAQRSEVQVYDLPEMGNGTDITAWPKLTHREVIPGFWTGGYCNSLIFWQGKLWAAPRKYYDTNPPATFDLFAADGETKLINLPRQLYSGFVKRGPGLDPMIGCGGYESGQGWGRGPTLATLDSEILISQKQTNDWDEMTPRDPNYSGEPWVAVSPRGDEGRWACDRVYSGGLVLPEGIVYWPYMGTSDLDYKRQTITFASIKNDKTYKYIYDAETYELLSYKLMIDGPSPVHGQELDADGKVYLALGNQWRGDTPYIVDPTIRVYA